MIDIKERLRDGTLSEDFIASVIDHIATLEQEVKNLHISLAGAVQHGEQGWQRYESANRMCINQQNEIVRLSTQEVG